MKLRVPLQSEDIGFPLQADGFDHAIPLATRLDPQATAQGLDRLMMNRDHLSASRAGVELRQTRILRPFHRVTVAIIVVMNVCSGRRDLRRDILVQRTAARHIDHIGARLQLCQQASYMDLMP